METSLSYFVAAINERSPVEVLKEEKHLVTMAFTEPFDNPLIPEIQRVMIELMAEAEQVYSGMSNNQLRSEYISEYIGRMYCFINYYDELYIFQWSNGKTYTFPDWEGKSLEEFVKWLDDQQ